MITNKIILLSSILIPNLKLYELLSLEVMVYGYSLNEIRVVIVLNNLGSAYLKPWVLERIPYEDYHVGIRFGKSV
jgi:hypothetical protein